MANATVSAGYVAVLSESPDTMRTHAAYLSVLSGTPSTMQVHAAYISVLVPVDPSQRRRPGVIISDG